MNWRDVVMSEEKLRRQSDDLQRLATNRLATIVARVVRRDPRVVRRQLEKKP